jgi:hypothetical protein
MPLLIARQLSPPMKQESCAVVISLFLTFVAASCNVIVYTEEVESNGTVGIYAGSPGKKTLGIRHAAFDSYRRALQ